jgi:hypothetical protein
MPIYLSALSRTNAREKEHALQIFYASVTTILEKRGDTMCHYCKLFVYSILHTLEKSDD